MSDSVGKFCSCLVFARAWRSFVTLTATSFHDADRVFAHALSTVKRIPRTGSMRPLPADRHRLYGLYKQSMEGDVEHVMKRPEGNGPEAEAEREKWWEALLESFV